MKFQKNYVYLLDNSGLGNQLYMLAYADYIRQQGYPTSILSVSYTQLLAHETNLSISYAVIIIS